MRGREQRVATAIPLLVALLTVFAFLPVLQAGFVSWDDNRNFLDNLHYRGLGWPELRWMWTTFHLGHYVPLSWMTLGLDHVLWGMNPAGYHATNLLLHTANAVLVYFLARRILLLAADNRSLGPSGPRDDRPPETLPIAAALAALVFSVHPLRVESVAWITERRDLLSLLCYGLSLLCYLRAIEREAAGRTWYRLALTAFVCALLSKGTSVSLPALFLILNVYPLRRLGGSAGWWGAAARRVYRELLPFGLLAAAASLLTIVALRPPDQLGLGGKLAVSAYSLAFYLWKTLVPLGLAPLYEMPQAVDPLGARYLLSYALALALAFGLWSIRRTRPGLVAAACAFLAIIFPMLGLVQNGPQIAADRYTYHAAPVLGLLAGAGFALARRPPLVVRTTLAALLIAAFGVLTWRQTGIWHDSERLWSQVLRLNANSSIAQIAMGDLLLKQDRITEAADHYARGVELDPEYPEGQNNLGVVLWRQGKVPEAIARYERALELRPEYSDAHNNWGIALSGQGRLAEAIEHFRRALAINPENADAETNWGNALVRLGKPAEAIEHYQAAVRLRPDHADAELNWGVALAQQSRFAEAAEHFRRALALKPDHAEAREYLQRAEELQRSPVPR